MHRILLYSLTAAGLALAVGCRQEKIVTYDVPREQAVAAAAKMPLPSGWEEAPLGEMRAASFTIKGTNGAKADFGVVALPNMGSRDLENVNRWRSSVGQKPLTEEELAKAAQTITVGGVEGRLYEVAGASAETDDPTRVLGVVAVKDGTGWYFKVTGDDKLVAAQKPTILAFLKDFNFQPRHDDHAGHNHGAETADAGQGSDPHAGLNVTTAPPTPESGPDRRSWPAPASWQQQAPGPMQQAKFAVAGGKAMVTVSEAGGGMGMNVNRWRGQIGLEALPDDQANKAVTSVDLSGTQAKLVDIAGAQQRMIVIVVPKGDTSVFYKLMGEPTAVAAEKDALIEFAKKVK